MLRFRTRSDTTRGAPTRHAATSRLPPRNDISTRKASLFSIPTREEVHRASVVTMIRSPPSSSEEESALLLSSLPWLPPPEEPPIMALTEIGLKNARLRTSSPASTCITVANASYGPSTSGRSGADPGANPQRTLRDMSMTESSPPCMDFLSEGWLLLLLLSDGVLSSFFLPPSPSFPPSCSELRLPPPSSHSRLCPGWNAMPVTVTSSPCHPLGCSTVTSTRVDPLAARAPHTSRTVSCSGGTSVAWIRRAGEVRSILVP
mmetsp:Transcript_31598/g.57859  ORF Transcript_31598/g.57859 Transcript_31598/m.57859 type:complete len:261 (+) Transcript_31598:662-1444(+)